MNQKVNFIAKYNTKFYVGILAIITGFLATIYNDFLGLFLGVIVFVVGIYSVIISEQSIWAKLIVLLLTTIGLLFSFGVISI